MINEWQKFKGWSVLEHFLLHPNSRIHINGLARELSVSPQTAQKFCVSYARDGLLLKAEVGNVHQYCLNGSDARVRALKRFVGPYLAADVKYLGPFLEKNRNALSVAVYGSFATGEYGDRSDLDLLVLTADDAMPRSEDFGALEPRLGREVNVTPISLAKWRQMERNKDNLFLSIKKTGVVVWGNPI